MELGTTLERYEELRSLTMSQPYVVQDLIQSTK